MAKRTDSYMMKAITAKTPEAMTAIIGDGIGAIQSDLHKVITGVASADIQLAAEALKRELDLLTESAGQSIE